MTTVYIHIGAPKTATSSIQSTLAQQHKTIERSGVLYPSQCRHGDAHHVLVCDLIEQHQRGSMPDVWYGDYPRGTAWKALLREIEAFQGALKSVVISSELFFGQTKNIGPMLSSVQESLRGFDVKVIAYLRRQDELYSSFFNQDVKGVRQWSGSAYEFYETHQIFLRDYHSLLSAWAEVFGEENILVRPYEREQWLDHDIMHDFASLVDGMPMLKMLTTERNEALGPTHLYIKRCLNYVGYDKADNEEILRLVSRLFKEAPQKNAIYINRGLFGRYREQWLAVNNRIAQSFLAGQELFSSEIPTAAQVSAYRFDINLLLPAIEKIAERVARGKFGDHQQVFARAALLMLSELKVWDRVPKTAQESLLRFA